MSKETCFHVCVYVCVSHTHTHTHTHTQAAAAHKDEALASAHEEAARLQRKCEALQEQLANEQHKLAVMGAAHQGQDAALQARILTSALYSAVCSTICAVFSAVYTVVQYTRAQYTRAYTPIPILGVYTIY